MRGHTRSRLVHRVLQEQNAEAISPAERMRLMSEPQSIAHLRDRLAANSIIGTFGASDRFDDAPLRVRTSKERVVP